MVAKGVGHLSRVKHATYTEEVSMPTLSTKGFLIYQSAKKKDISGELPQTN